MNETETTLHHALVKITAVFEVPVDWPKGQEPSGDDFLDVVYADAREYRVDDFSDYEMEVIDVQEVY